MLSRTLLLILAAMPAIAQPADGPIHTVLEQAIESSSAATRIPNGAPSTILIKQCDTCAAQSLRITRDTRFLLGREAVTQQAFVSSYARQSTPVSLVIFFDAKSSAITRVITPGTTPEPRN